MRCEQLATYRRTIGEQLTSVQLAAYRRMEGEHLPSEQLALMGRMEGEHVRRRTVGEYMGHNIRAQLWGEQKANGRAKLRLISLDRR